MKGRRGSSIMPTRSKHLYFTSKVVLSLLAGLVLLQVTVSGCYPFSLFSNMMGFRSFLSLALPTASSATLMYVTSYAGTLTTLNLTTPAVGDNSSKASLAQVSVTDGCAGSTSWLTLDSANNILYCLDEAFASPNGTLVTFRTSDNGTLTQLDKVPTLGGPVSAVLYGSNATGLAVAE